MIEVINNLTLIFIVASITLMLFDRINHPSIPAYIFSGILIGPIAEYFFGPLVSQDNILVLAQIGIAFLVFILGTSLETGKIHNLIKGNISLTVIKTALLGLPVFLIAYIYGFDVFNSIYLALAASLSSSLISIEILDTKVKNIIYHRLTNSINLIQDIIAIFIFIIVASEPLSAPVIGMNVVIGMTILALGFLGKTFIPLLIEYLGKSREMYILISASTLLIFGALSELTGLTIVVGAFAGGIALSKKPYNQEVVHTIGSMKDFFTAIFFVSLGALLVLPSIEVIVLSSVLMLVIIFIKPLSGIYTLQTNGYDKRTSYMTALNLDQVSEYVLVIAIQAFIANKIAPEVFQAIILAATVTMITSSYTSRHSEKIYKFIENHKWLDIIQKEFVDKNFSEKSEDHFIVGGYDIQGKEITETLEKEGEDVIVIENNPQKVMEARTDGVKYIYGDMMVDDVWEKSFFRDAKMIISTVPLEKISDKVIDLETEADKIIRAKTMDQVKKYIDQCLYVIYPHFLSTKKLIEHLKGSLESEEYRKRLKKITREEID